MNNFEELLQTVWKNETPISKLNLKNVNKFYVLEFILHIIGKQIRKQIYDDLEKRFIDFRN